jgi:hypothetical protein
MTKTNFSLQDWIDEVVYNEPWRIEKIHHVIAHGICRAAEHNTESAKYVLVETQIYDLEMGILLNSLEERFHSEGYFPAISESDTNYAEIATALIKNGWRSVDTIDIDSKVVVVYSQSRESQPRKLGYCRYCEETTWGDLIRPDQWSKISADHTSDTYWCQACGEELKSLIDERQDELAQEILAEHDDVLTMESVYGLFV